MERVLVSRQPIYHADMAEVGYELLFCNNGDADGLASTVIQTAKSNLFADTFLQIGLDQVVGKRLAFINFDRDLILSNYCESLPQERVVLEILKSVTPDTDMVKKLERLRGSGYRIALDGSLCNTSMGILRLANFAKIDLAAYDWPELERLVKSIFNKYPPIRLVAENVQTREQFANCKELGFDCFQGGFFCRPQFFQGRRVPISRIAAVRLITTLNSRDIDLKELESVISQDVSLTYKLLRYINSASYSLRAPVGSIGHAIMLLGQEQIRTWASLILLSNFDDKSRDMIITATARARMAENLAKALELPHPERMFFTGLISVLDGLLDQPLETILPTLPIEQEVAEALLFHKGSLGAVLRCVLEYENRNWDAAQSATALPDMTIREAYQQSLAWSLTTLNAVSAN